MFKFSFLKLSAKPVKPENIELNQKVVVVNVLQTHCECSTAPDNLRNTFAIHSKAQTLAINRHSQDSLYSQKLENGGSGPRMPLGTAPCAFCPHDATCEVRPGSEPFRRFVRDLKEAAKGHRIAMDEDCYVVDGDRLQIQPCLRPVIEEIIEAQEERNRVFQRENDYLVRRFCHRCRQGRRMGVLTVCKSPPLDGGRRVGLPISGVMRCPRGRWRRKAYPPCEGCGQYRDGLCMDKTCGWAILTGPSGWEDFR